MTFDQQTFPLTTALFAPASESSMFSLASGEFQTYGNKKHYFHCTCGKCTSKRRARKAKSRTRRQSRRKNR